MKNNRHRFLASILCALMVLTLMLPMGHVARAEEGPSTEEQELLETSPETPSVPVGEGAAETDFEFDPATGTITKYNGNDAEVTIPDTIQGKSVKAIGEEAFQGKPTLRKVTLPASVETIGSSAFSGDSALQEVKLNDGLRSIGDHAFSACTALQSMNIPASVETIEFYAFEACIGLKEVILHEGLKKIGNMAFTQCTTLQSIDIPGSVETIEESAFLSCGTDVDEFRVTFKEGGKTLTLGDYTFQECNSLKKMTVPGRAKEIPGGMFNYCTNLKKVVFEVGVETMQGYIFNGCEESLKEIWLPGTIKSIDEYAFASNTAHVHIHQYRKDPNHVKGEPWEIDLDNGGKISFLNGETDFAWTAKLAENKYSSQASYTITVTESKDAKATDDRIAIRRVTVKDPDGNIVEDIKVPENDQFQFESQFVARQNGDYTVRVDYAFIGQETHTINVNGIISPPPAPDADVTPRTVTLTFRAPGAVFSDQSTDEKIYYVRAGEHFTIPAGPKKEGYKFLYWEGSKFYPGDDYVVPAGGHTFTAVWEKKEEKKPETKPEIKPGDFDRYLRKLHLTAKPLTQIPKAGVGQAE